MEKKMAKRGKKKKHNTRKMPAFVNKASNFEAKAPLHTELSNNNVHIFVDDQNLFFGIINNNRDQSYRIEFGDLMRVAAHSSETGYAREVKSAYIAGVIPDDDSFWEAAKAKGFDVHRGFLNASRRSKQDDAYLITSIMETLYEHEGPSTMVLVAGDADYVPPLQKCLKKGWRVEIAFVNQYSDISNHLSPVCHEFRSFSPVDIQRKVV